MLGDNLDPNGGDKQPRKPAGSANGTGGEYDHKPAAGDDHDLDPNGYVALSPQVKAANQGFLDGAVLGDFDQLARTGILLNVVDAYGYGAVIERVSTVNDTITLTVDDGLGGMHEFDFNFLGGGERAVWERDDHGAWSKVDAPTVKPKKPKRQHDVSMNLPFDAPGVLDEARARINRDHDVVIHAVERHGSELAVTAIDNNTGRKHTLTMDAARYAPDMTDGENCTWNDDTNGFTVTKPAPKPKDADPRKGLPFDTSRLLHGAATQLDTTHNLLLESLSRDGKDLTAIVIDTDDGNRRRTVRLDAAAYQAKIHNGETWSTPNGNDWIIRTSITPEEDTPDEKRDRERVRKEQEEARRQEEQAAQRQRLKIKRLMAWAQILAAIGGLFHRGPRRRRRW